jgi:hypothetical protein
MSSSVDPRPGWPATPRVSTLAPKVSHCEHPHTVRIWHTVAMLIMDTEQGLGIGPTLIARAVCKWEQPLTEPRDTVTFDGRAEGLSHELERYAR